MAATSVLGTNAESSSCTVAIVEGEVSPALSIKETLASAGMLAVEPSGGAGHQPSAVVFPIGTVEPQALARLADFRDQLPKTALIVTVEQVTSRDCRRLLGAGVLGIVLNHTLAECLVPTIRAAVVGQLTVAPQLQANVRPPILTSREKQILSQVTRGLTNAEIASKLYLAESTVKSHLSSAFSKLGVTSRNEAAALILDPHHGAKLGILPVPSETLPAPT